MSKREVWSNGVLVSTEDVPDVPEPPDPVVTLASALLDAQSLEEVRAAAQAALVAAGGA